MPESESSTSRTGAASVLATAPAHFSWLQTRMALERTLLAWVRTAASLIGFGFAIFHFFEALNSMPGVAPERMHGTSRFLGAALVGIGTLALVLALVQYLVALRYLEGPMYREISSLEGVPRFRPGLVVSIVLTFVGAITFWVLLVRLPV